MSSLVRPPDGIYVTGPRWHLVHGPAITTPETGRAYLFRCFRWMTAREADEKGIFRGTPPDEDEICGDCMEQVGLHAKSGSAGAEPHGDEPGFA